MLAVTLAVRLHLGATLSTRCARRSVRTGIMPTRPNIYALRRVRRGSTRIRSTGCARLAVLLLRSSTDLRWRASGPARSTAPLPTTPTTAPITACSSAPQLPPSCIPTTSSENA